MKKQYTENPTPTTQQEFEMLKSQLGAEDLYIIGYLKGFNRKVMREWSEKGLWA